LISKFTFTTLPCSARHSSHHCRRSSFHATMSSLPVLLCSKYTPCLHAVALVDRQHVVDALVGEIEPVHHQLQPPRRTARIFHHSSHSMSRVRFFSLWRLMPTNGLSSISWCSSAKANTAAPERQHAIAHIRRLDERKLDAAACFGITCVG
jgi:hypothetical protein